MAVLHGDDIEYQKGQKLADIQSIPCSGDHEPILIEDWGFGGVIQCDGLILVVVGYYIDEG